MTEDPKLPIEVFKHAREEFLSQLPNKLSYISDVKSQASTYYTAEDGLFGLYQSDFRDGYDSYPMMTVNNDNGVLYLAYYAFLQYKVGSPSSVDASNWRAAIYRTKGEADGLFDRNPQRRNDLNSIDNYTGTVSLLRLCLDISQIDLVVAYGSKNGYIYDNTGQLNIKAWRQGSDIAFYKLCANQTPTLWEFAWLLGAIVVNAFQDPGFRTDETLQTWLRFEALQDLRPETKILKVMAASLQYARKFWQFMINRKTLGLGVVWSFYQRFETKHPIAKLAMLLDT